MKLNTRVRDGRVESETADGQWIDEGPARRTGPAAPRMPPGATTPAEVWKRLCRVPDPIHPPAEIHVVDRGFPCESLAPADRARRGPGILFYGVGILGAVVVALVVVALALLPIILL